MTDLPFKDLKVVYYLYINTLGFALRNEEALEIDKISCCDGIFLVKIKSEPFLFNSFEAMKWKK